MFNPLAHLGVRDTPTGKVLVQYNYIAMLSYVLVIVGVISYGSLYFTWSPLRSYLSDFGIVGGGVLLFVFDHIPCRVIGPFKG